jgi:uncharacterized protein
VSERPPEPHFPGRATIDGYGAGGFRFAGMSHRGSILALPSGIWGWAPREPSEISVESLDRVIAEAPAIELLFIGTGADIYLVPEALRWRLRDAGIRFEALTTAAAASTYNVLFVEGRRIAAALIATA